MNMLICRNNGARSHCRIRKFCEFFIINNIICIYRKICRCIIIHKYHEARALGLQVGLDYCDYIVRRLRKKKEFTKRSPCSCKLTWCIIVCTSKSFRTELSYANYYSYTTNGYIYSSTLIKILSRSYYRFRFHVHIKRFIITRHKIKLFLIKKKKDDPEYNNEQQVVVV